MRLGELLVRKHGLAERVLARALETQRRRHIRLASLLIEQGALDFDQASRALGEQRGVASVLVKHLAARNAELAKLVPAELARSEHVLPIGRTSKGVLIVCARDPSPELRAKVEKAAGESVTLIVIPATRLESLLVEAHGDAVEEFDVDLGSAVGIPPAPPAPPAPSRPAPAPALRPSAPPARASTSPSVLVSPPRAPSSPSILTSPPPRAQSSPSIAGLDPDALQFSLADLDDARVEKDPSQSGNLNAQSLRSALPPPPPPFEPTRDALDRATSRDAATDAAMPFLAGRFEAVLVLAIRGRRAIGYRGAGPAMGEVDAIAIDLDLPSTLQRALDSKKTSIQPGTSSAQDELAARLGTPMPSAVPVLVAGTPVALIAVGDPIHGFGETERSLMDLNRAATALAAAYERIAGAR